MSYMQDAILGALQMDSLSYSWQQTDEVGSILYT